MTKNKDNDDIGQRLLQIYTEEQTIWVGDKNITVKRDNYITGKK